MELSDGVHSFMSFTTSYKDTGLSGIYFTAEEQGLRTISEAVCTEWKRLAEEVDENELERAKKSLYTNMLLMLDGSTPICEDIGRLCGKIFLSQISTKFDVDAFCAKNCSKNRLCTNLNPKIYFLLKTSILGNFYATEEEYPFPNWNCE